MKHADKYARYVMALQHAREANKYLPPSGRVEDWVEEAVDLVWGDDVLVGYDDFVKKCNLEEEE